MKKRLDDIRIMSKNIRIMSKYGIDVLFSKTKSGLLANMLLKQDKWWYLSELAKHMGVSPSTLQRDLDSFAKAGLINKKQDGNRAYFRANDKCPYFKELQGLIIKTVGVRNVIYEIIKEHEFKICVAFIYGSIARGEEVSSSDIDLMIIGDVKLSKIASNIRNAEKRLMREINPVIFPAHEFKKKYKEKSNFIINVSGETKLYLIGSENEFKEIIK
jgi:uncharacterized protein